ncbi:hypothetical protein WCD74_28225 [Actinomycetospora sp. OC33-EN08]|uniref:Uncharacterized protein n=1 Tax=Actinomycetospora aurantiaca TaxID=3129233 RepID=A0ABU8MXK8_9PSEU
MGGVLRADRGRRRVWEVSRDGAPLTTIHPARRSETLALPDGPLRRWTEGFVAPTDVLGDGRGFPLARTGRRGWRDLTFWVDGRWHGLWRAPGTPQRWVLYEGPWVYGAADLEIAATGRWTDALRRPRAVVVDMPPLSFVGELFVLLVLVGDLVAREESSSM